MRVFQSLAILLVLASTSLAQISVRQVSVIEASEKAEKIGTYVIVPKDFSAKPFNIVHAKWETKVPPERLRIKLTNSARQSIPFIDLKDNGIVVSQIGHFWLEVRGSYFDKTAQDIFEIDEEVDFFVDAIGPTPTPTPDPPGPLPPPDKIDNLSVLMVYESALAPTYRTAQRSVMQSTDLRIWMNQNLPKDTQQSPNWRVLDKDTQFPSSSDTVYKKWLTTPPSNLPYLIIGNKDTIVFQGELPENIEDIKALVLKYKK